MTHALLTPPKPEILSSEELLIISDKNILLALHNVLSSATYDLRAKDLAEQWGQFALECNKDVPSVNALAKNELVALLARTLTVFQQEKLKQEERQRKLDGKNAEEYDRASHQATQDAIELTKTLVADLGLDNVVSAAQGSLAKPSGRKGR